MNSQFLRNGNLFQNTSYMKIRMASCSFDSYSFHVNWLKVKALIRLKTKFAAAEKKQSKDFLTTKTYTMVNCDLPEFRFQKRRTLRSMRFEI